jgi:hypothetical protein
MCDDHFSENSPFIQILKANIECVGQINAKRKSIQNKERFIAKIVFLPNEFEQNNVSRIQCFSRG